MADGSYHPDDDATAQGDRAIRMAVERRIDQIVQDEAMARKAFDRREQAARFILDGLDGADWLDVAAQIARRLTEEERVGLLAGVIKSLPDDLTKQVLDAMFDGGVPGSDPKDHMAAAKFWADDAMPSEIRSFVTVGIKRMPKETRSSLLKALQEGRL